MWVQKGAQIRKMMETAEDILYMLYAFLLIFPSVVQFLILYVQRCDFPYVTRKKLNKHVSISTVVDDCSTVVHMPRLHGHHMLSHFGGGLNVDTSALSSTSVRCQIWKSTSIHEWYKACSLAPHVKGFARVDETDALTDLRGLGEGLLASHCVAH